MALIFFDYDGVMVDSLEAENAYFQEACQEVGVEGTKDAADMAKLSEGNFYENFHKRGVSMEDIAEIMKVYARVKTDGRYTTEPFPEIFDLLKKVSDRFPVYIITSNVSATVETRLQEFGVDGVKDVLGADKETSKAKKLRAIMAQYPGERTFFIGDTKGDMVESAEVGVDVRLGVTWGWQRPEVVLEGDPDYWFNEKNHLVAWFEGFMDATK
ncbi:MAG: HAD family hydrolase [Firmicutes bacterium]|nr:HAD family hydrolase [Bacillota bacterium]